MAEVPKKMLVTSELEKNLIFQNMMKLKLPLHVCFNDIEYPGFIERIGSEGIVVRLAAPTMGGIEGAVRTNFAFHSNYHYFSTEARTLGQQLILLHPPEQINKNMVRMHERTDAHGKVFMKFRILIRANKHELRGTSLLANERVLMQEVKKPRPAVDKMLSAVKNLVSEFSQGFQLKIFKPGEKLSFEELIVKETKKVFLLYDSLEDSIEEKKILDEGLITLGGVYERLIARGEPRKAVESRLLDFLDRKRKDGKFSECFVPLVVEGEVAGCLRLSNDLDYHRSIKPALALKAMEYVSLLTEALVKYDYFNLKSGDEFKIPVLNISTGGLLFRLEDPRLGGYIVKGSILLMALLFDDRQVRARGVVYRVEEEKATYGVKFQEIGEEDANYIDGLVRQMRPVCS
jgi:hypothetical protein